MTNKRTLTWGILIVLVALAVWQWVPFSGQTVQYRNEQFGFSVDLPDSWDGFTVTNQPEDIYDVTGTVTANNGVVATFPTIRIGHPAATVAVPRQDIPIMVFTRAQWERISAGDWSVGAAPIPPSELARNDAHVFALPARYNYAFPEGFEEVEQILLTSPVRAF